jgi:hypothetical protein
MNFCGKKRKGKNNLYYKLPGKTSKNLTSIGSAHVVHSAGQTAVDCLPIDLQLIINTIYQHFHIYSVRVEELKSLCEFTETEYIPVLGHSEARWLSLLYAAQRIIYIFPALKSYFLSLEKCLVKLDNFFENPLSFILLPFFSCQLETFSHTTKCIEKQDTAIIEVKNEVSKLLDKLSCRKTEISYNSCERSAARTRK